MSVAVKLDVELLSLLLPGTRIRPHTGPRNDRLRLHCTILSPRNAAKIRVGPRIWRYYNNSNSNVEEECFVFDESCEHEVIFETNDSIPRIVLIVDFVNPSLDPSST